MTEEGIPLWRLVFNALMKNGVQDNGPTGPFSVPPWARMSRFGTGGHPRPSGINVDWACGYPEETELDVFWFKRAYHRWGIAARVVDIWPDECWAGYPEVYDGDDPGHTPFDDAWNEILEDHIPFHYLHQLDRLSGIGQYAVMFMGLDDGGKISDPPEGIDRHTGQWLDPANPPKYKLTYLTPFDQTYLRVAAVEKDSRNPRFQLPKYYAIQFYATPSSGVGPDGNRPDPEELSIVETKVHFSRVLHFADNCISSKFIGTPRLLNVANHLHDLRKVTGGSAEMFWRGGFPGYAFETYPELAGEDILAATDLQKNLKEQIESYQLGLQRYLAVVGGRWNSLSPQVANPDKHLEWYVKLICATQGIPTKTFLGSEAGHQAGQKDDENWKYRCRGRQTRKLLPLLVRPFVDRMILFGCLPKPQGTKGRPGRYKTDWGDIMAMSDKDKIDIALKKTQALQTFFAGGIEQKFAERLFLTLIMGFTEDQADAIAKELKENKPKDPIALISAPPQPPAGGSGIRKNNRPAAARSGRPSGGRRDGEPRLASQPGSAGRRARMYANLRGE
jgi:hypothetical protein